MVSALPRSQSYRAPLGCGEWEICITDVQPTNLQQLPDAIMSVYTKISEECFQQLVEFASQKIKPVLMAKGSPTQQGIPNKVESECT